MNSLEPKPLRLLLINFEMNPGSQVLGWQASVAAQLATECDSITVLTGRNVKSALPTNVAVLEFPRPLLRAPLRWVGGRWWMNVYVAWLCWRRGINVCFIHMNMMWGRYLAPSFWLLRIPVLLWYAHGTVSKRLIQAHRRVSRVVTSTPEGFRIPSDKVRIIGQGIDAELFAPGDTVPEALDVITVSRVSARKRLDLMVRAMDRLWDLEPRREFRLVVVGAPITQADRDYAASLEQMIRGSRHPSRIVFAGHLSPVEIRERYRSAFVHLNLSGTGSMDKSVMESLAVGCPVLTSNEAFRELLAEYPSMLLVDVSPDEIARRLAEAYNADVDAAALRALVTGKHDLATYGTRIAAELRDLLATAHV